MNQKFITISSLAHELCPERLVSSDISNNVLFQNHSYSVNCKYFPNAMLAAEFINKQATKRVAHNWMFKKERENEKPFMRQFSVYLTRRK